MRIFLTALSALILMTVARGQDLYWGQSIDAGWPNPCNVHKSDLLGKTRTQLLKMGRDEWNAFAWDQRKSDERGDGVVNSVDGPDLVYAYCLEWRNNRLIRRLPTKRATLIHSLRSRLTTLMLIGIVIEDTESGGGTYGIHYPRYAHILEEETIYELLSGPESRDDDVNFRLKAVNNELTARTYREGTFETRLGRVLNTSEVAKLAMLCRHGLHILHLLTPTLSELKPSEKAAVADSLFQYCADYLYIRDQNSPYGKDD